MNKQINEKLEATIESVGSIVDGLTQRAKKVDFTTAVLDEYAVSDLKLHLGYVRAYSDLARVRLHYYKTLKQESIDEQS